MSSSRLYPARPILATSIAVFRDERVLLGRRTSPLNSEMDSTLPFSLPGGVVECGENLSAAAVRELAEETAVQAEIIDMAGYHDLIEKDKEGKVRRHFVIITFAARWRAGEGQASPELDPLIWASPHDLQNLTLTKNLAPMIEKARKLV
jgi:ADP-ribose pyrophosphatase YjhB (NUDIX family)